MVLNDTGFIRRMIKFRTTFQLTNKVESNGFNDRQIALRITNSKAKIHETYIFYVTFMA